MMKILLDPGHGPGRSHNRGFIGGNEGDNNYHFATKLRQELLKYNNVQVDMTRTNISQNPSINSRSNQGRGYDLFLSIHSNAGGGTGPEVYDTVSGRNANRQLASRLTAACSEVLGLRNRGVKHKRRANGGDWFGVLYGNQAKSAMLLEMFFHDNRNDVNKFKANENKLAERLASEIAKYYGLSRKAQTSSSRSGQSSGGMTMLGNKPVAIISIAKTPDYNNLEPLLDLLYPSYNVVITRSGKFDYEGIVSNYIIGVGGHKSAHSGYINYFISGKNRHETYEKIKDFASRGSKNRRKYLV